MRKDKILLVTQYFPPDMAGTGRVMKELAEDLSDSGYALEVIAGTTHYFNKKNYRDYVNKFPVKRVWHLRFSDASKIGRLLNFVSFPVFLLIRLFTFRKADAVVIVSNPSTIVAIGAIINLVWGKGVYYILQDIYPDLAIHLGVLSKKSLFARGMRYLNMWGFKHLKKIIVLSDSMNAYLGKSYGPQPEKIVTISNWADARKIYPSSKDNPWSQVTGYVDKFVILYAGNIGLSYDFSPILDAAEQLKEDKDILFLFVGEGRNKKLLKEQTHNKNLKNIDFMSYVADEDYNKLLASADCHVVVHKPGMDKYNLPGKVYSYLASGRPVITISDKRGELSQLISSSEAGVTVENAHELAEVMKKIKADHHLRAGLGENGREYLLKYYDRKLVTRKYLNIFE